MQITKEDYRGLYETITTVRKWLAQGEVRNADIILNTLVEAIGKNLGEDEISIDDLVKVVISVDEEKEGFVDEYAYIKGIDEQWQYPYNIEFINPKVERDNGYLWQAKDFEII